MRIFFLGLTVSLVGCAATQLNAGAERVMVTHSPAPPGCVFVGSIVGEQGGAITGSWTSNKNLAEGAFNDMKNKAVEIHANYVVLENTQAGNTVSGNRNSISGGQTDVTHVGNAYKCPEAGPPPGAAAQASAGPAPTPAAAVTPAASATPAPAAAAPVAPKPTLAAPPEPK